MKTKADDDLARYYRRLRRIALRAEIAKEKA